jgi:predicted dehydrogenase
MRVGVIGGGAIAQEAHLPALASMPQVEIVLCERVLAHGRQLASTFPIAEVVSDLDDPAMSKCDALFVMVPHAAMFEVTRRCLSTGTPTLLEKPPGMTLDETRELALMAEAQRVMNMVGFNSRFRPDLRAGLARLQEHTRISTVLAYGEMPTPDRLAFAGVLDDVLANVLPAHCIHRIDLFRFLLGEPLAVYADVRAIASRFPNSFNAMITFESGVAQLQYSLMSPRRHASLRIMGWDYSVQGDGEGAHLKVTLNSPAGAEAIQVIAPAGISESAYAGGYLLQDTYFLDCLERGRAVSHPAADLASAAKTMELLDAIRRGHSGPLNSAEGRA